MVPAFTRPKGLWLRAISTLVAGSVIGSEVLAQDIPIRRIGKGDRYTVRIKNTLDGSLQIPPMKKDDPPKSVSVKGEANVAFAERALAVDSKGSVTRAFRVYDLVDYQRNIGNQPEKSTLRKAVRRIVLHRDGPVEKPYSLDGPLYWSEVSLLATHVFVPALEGFLPTRPTVKGDAWEATPEAVSELIGLAQIESGKLSCRHNGTIELGGESVEQLAFTGIVVGRISEGPINSFRTKSTVRGAAYVGVKSRRLHSLRAVGTLEVLGEQDKVIGALDVDWQMIVSALEDDDEELSDAAVAAIPAEPTDEMTALLYEHAGLGFRMKHPRRWFLATVQGAQILVRHPAASMVINIEPIGAAPSAEQFRDEVQAFLRANKIAAEESAAIQSRRNEHGSIGHFSYRATLDGRRVILDYWVVERGRRGATIAATVDAEAWDGALADEIQRIARSLTFSAPLEPIPIVRRLESPKAPDAVKTQP